MAAEARRIIFASDAQFAAKPAADGKPAQLVGYPIVWGAVSTDRGGYRVRLLKDSAKFTNQVHALFHHDFQAILADTVSGTLRYSADDRGIRCEIDLPDTQLGRDVMELVKTRRVRGMSFAMTRLPKGFETTENGLTILNVESFEADEFTVTPTPSFQETNIDIKPPADAGGYAARSAQALELERLRFASLRLPG